MARGFGSTYGSGSTDRATTTLTAHGSQRTYAVWLWRNGGGGSNLGRVFDKRTASGEVELCFTGTVDTRFARAFSGGTGVWGFNNSSFAAGWNHLAIAYDSGSVSNDPTIYLNGSAIALTVDSNPGSGTANTNTDAYVLGNRGTDAARNWDGMLAEWAVWDRLISVDEARALAAGYSPAFFSASLVSYVPLLRDSVDELRTAPTLTGTAVQPHPAIQYPVPPQMLVPPASAATVSSFFFRNFVLSRRA